MLEDLRNNLTYYYNIIFGTDLNNYLHFTGEFWEASFFFTEVSNFKFEQKNYCDEINLSPRMWEGGS